MNIYIEKSKNVPGKLFMVWQQWPRDAVGGLGCIRKKQTTGKYKLADGKIPTGY